jgi:hypothetical protein
VYEHLDRFENSDDSVKGWIRPESPGFLHPRKQIRQPSLRTSTRLTSNLLLLLYACV